MVLHKNEYERTYDELEITTKEERKKMVLVQDSLKSVKQQIEKVFNSFYHITTPDIDVI